jgi:hypothetical protein
VQFNLENSEQFSGQLSRIFTSFNFSFAANCLLEFMAVVSSTCQMTMYIRTAEISGQIKGR